MLNSLGTRWHLGLHFLFLYLNSVILHSCIFGNCSLFLISPHICTPPVHPPYICMPLYPLYICMFPHTICSPYVMGTLEHLYTQKVFGSFEGHQYICNAFLCLSVHTFASQLITVIPVDPHNCGLLLYWIGCLWMSTMLHAVVAFFVVFSLSLKLLLPQLQLLLLWWLLCALLCHLFIQWLHWPPPWWGFQQCQVNMM